jgi:hypothetical protein
VDVHDVTLVWRDHPACLCVFSRHRELQIGPVFGQDQAVLRRLTLGGRTVRTFFAATSTNVRELRVYQREVSGQVTGRLSVPYQSSFGELRMGPRLRDTLDTGLCCSSQGRGQLSQVIYKLSQVIYKVMSTSIYNLPHRHFWVPFAVSQWFPFVQHIRQGKQDGYPTNLDRLTYFQTHGELHKGPCTFLCTGV